MLSYTA